MKRPIYGHILLIFSLLAVACGEKTREGSTLSPEKRDRLREFALGFAEKASSGDRDGLKSIYPEIIKADSISLHYSPDSITVFQSDADIFDIRLSPDVRIRVTENDKGAFSVIESYGLFAYRDYRLKPALAGGMYDPTFPDAVLADRMKDREYFNYFNKITEERLDSILLPDVNIDETLNTNFMEVVKQGGIPELFLTIKNNSEGEIKPSDFKFKVEGQFSAFLGDGFSDNSWEVEEKGVSLQPGDSIVKFYSYGPNSMYYFRGIEFNLNRNELIERFVRYRGTEYKDYLRAREANEFPVKNATPTVKARKTNSTYKTARLKELPEYKAAKKR